MKLKSLFLAAILFAASALAYSPPADYLPGQSPAPLNLRIDGAVLPPEPEPEPMACTDLVHTIGTATEGSYSVGQFRRFYASPFLIAGAGTVTICAIETYCELNGTDWTGLTVRICIYGDTGEDEPDESNIIEQSDAVALSTLPAPGSPAWFAFTSGIAANLTYGTKYWIVMEQSAQDNPDYIKWHYDDDAVDEGVLYSTNGTSWTVTNTGKALLTKFYAEPAGGDVSVDATTDALTLTENAANINAEISIAASTDALAITTYDAGINAEINVAAGVDALAITPNAANVNAEINVLAGVDALAITEYAATVEVGANVEVAADTAALTITAYPAAVNAEINIAAGTDALAITEYPANINAGINVQAALAALAISEQAATVQLNVNVATALDALLLSTHAAGIKADISITAQVDALLLAEFAASVAVVALTADNPASTIYARGGTKSISAKESTRAIYAEDGAKTIRAKDGTKSIKASAGAGRVIHG